MASFAVSLLRAGIAAIAVAGGLSVRQTSRSCVPLVLARVTIAVTSLIADVHNQVAQGRACSVIFCKECRWNLIEARIERIERNDEIVTIENSESILVHRDFYVFWHSSLPYLCMYIVHLWQLPWIEN